MASPVAGTSLGRVAYQELLEFTWLDLTQGDSSMASRAREAWEDCGIVKDQETHYCMIRLVGLPIKDGVMCTFNLLPYGESVFKETFSVHSVNPGPAELAATIFGTIGLMFGIEYIDKLASCTAASILKWAISLGRITNQ